MKIYIPCFTPDPHDTPNPFIYTLTDEMTAQHDDIEFVFDADFLWTEECESVDIIHFMWPHIHSGKMLKGYDLEQRIKELKRKGVKIVATCHNFAAHSESNLFSSLSYDIVYRQCDRVIHLGSYSLEEFKTKYPDVPGTLIPHHVYDTVYANLPGREESLRHLRLKSKYHYILCFGAFRNPQERDLVKELAHTLAKTDIRIFAPAIVELPYGAKNPKRWFKPLREILKYKRSGVITNGRGYISDTELGYYYGAADACLIQRPRILNSGNVPMGLYMGKVVIGPDTGNVGVLLKETGNPTFTPGSMDSIIRAIKEALLLAENGIGDVNKSYCMENLRTSRIAEMHYSLYKQV